MSVKNLLALVVLFLGGSAQGAERRVIGRPDTAVRLAAKDAAEALKADPGTQLWYIWIRDSQDTELIEVYDYVLNTAFSRADYPIRSVKVDGGVAGMLLRIDLRVWLPEVQHKFNFLRIIEAYADPSFYLDTGEKIRKSFVCEPYTSDGKTFSRVAFPDFPLIEFAPAVSAYAGIHAAKLRELTGLAVPIVEAERWLVDSLRVQQNGLYYKLQGYDTFVGTTAKRLNQKEWLALFGADEDESDRLNGEEYIGLWRSNVTGKARRGKFLFGRAVRPSVGPPLVVITEDGADEDLGTDQHPIYSLFDFEFAATEILATRANGAIAYSLFSSAGELQDFAPGNIVEDHKVPEPHTSRVEPAISCIRCHASDSQWKPMPNQVRTLLSESFDGQRLEVLTDFSRDPHEVEHELRALYSGDLTTALKQARTSHEFASIKMVDFKLEGDGYAVEAANRVADRFNRYVYDAVDPVEALRTLGYVCSAEDAARALAKIIPTKGLTDPAIATLRLHSIDGSLVVNRTDWERVYQAVLSHALAFGKVNNDPPING